MLTPNDIADRLDELVKEAFPGEEVHRELVPQGFRRPCNLIVQEPWKSEPGFGTGVIMLHPVYTLTTFVEVDEYYHTHLATMHLRQLKLLGLLLPGYVKVGDRAPKVESIEMAGGYDYDTVTVTFGYTLDRQNFEKIKQWPNMEQLHMRMEVRTYG